MKYALLIVFFLAGCGHNSTAIYGSGRSSIPTPPEPTKPPPVTPPAVTPPAVTPPPVVPPAPAPAPAPAPVDYLVAWVAPATNTDGSPLSNLAGYRIYYWVGMAARQVIDIPDQGAVSYTVTNLGHGTWSFCMTAYNAEQTESSCSDTITVTK